MDKLVIRGGVKLEGVIDIGGSKNAALPIMAAALLSAGKSVLKNVPRLTDVDTMMNLLNYLGANSWRGAEGELIIEGAGVNKTVAPYELVSTMRASISVLGPLLARMGRANVSHPGGCVIGPRPIDLHIKGLRKLGANISIEHGYVVAAGEKLKGADIYLGGPFGSTVLGTANVMTAAVLAEGITRIENAACEPEIVDLAEFLCKMGARIEGAGTHIVKISGVARLNGAEHEIIPDRVETGTHIIAAAITRGDVLLRGAVYEHIGAVADKLEQANVRITRQDDGLRVSAGGGLTPVDVVTMPYPGFPTDMQAQMMTLMLCADGISVITERIYPDRFMHVSELLRMGADIMRESERVIVRGGRRLSGAKVMASDLRASAALVLAGLVAEGETEISRVYHLDRGYERMEEKLSSAGADIKRV